MRALGITDLTRAIHAGDLQAAHQAVCSGASLEGIAQPPLLAAVTTGNPEMVRLLINAGASPLASAARQTAQGAVEQALSFPDALPESGPASEDAFLECLELVDGLGTATATSVRQRRRAFVLKHFHDPGHRVTRLHRIVRAITGQQVSLPTITSDLKRLGLR